MLNTTASSLLRGKQRLVCSVRAFASSSSSSSAGSSSLADRIEKTVANIKARGGSNVFARHVLENYTGHSVPSFAPVPYSSPVSTVNNGCDDNDNAIASMMEQRHSLSDAEFYGHVKKISIVGCGQVGLGAAFAILNQGVADCLALTDVNGERLEGEIKDLRQGSAFYGHRARIEGSTDYGVTADSDLVIITAGVAQKPGESRLSLLGRNTAIMRSIIHPVLEHSPNATICIATNPCDIMTAIAAKIAGPNVDPGRIFGSGTVLDSSRLQTLLGATLDVDARDCRGYIIGEHGDSSVPVFSSVKVGGVPLLQHGADPDPAHIAMHREVVDSAGDVICKKGYTNWAVGMACSHIAKAVIHNERRALTVSTCVRGLHGIEEDVFLSMPCIVDAKGVSRVVNLPLTEWETERLQQSAKKIWEMQSTIWNEV
eukprot:scaffold9801_cov51-Attheya_sp.AAC.2